MQTNMSPKLEYLFSMPTNICFAMNLPDVFYVVFVGWDLFKLLNF